MIKNIYILLKEITWVLSSVVEHLTADQEVIGSIPIVPLLFLFFNTKKIIINIVKKKIFDYIYQNDIADTSIRKNIIYDFSTPNS